MRSQPPNAVKAGRDAIQRKLLNSSFERLLDTRTMSRDLCREASALCIQSKSRATLTRLLRSRSLTINRIVFALRTLRTLQVLGPERCTRIAHMQQEALDELKALPEIEITRAITEAECGMRDSEFREILFAMASDMRLNGFEGLNGGFGAH